MSSVGDLKTKVEEATAKNFIEWYNKIKSRGLAFLRRPSIAPDFVYSDEDGEISLEITTVHYDQDHAKAINETARGIRKAYTVREIIEAPELVEMHSVHEPEKN